MMKIAIRSLLLAAGIASPIWANEIHQASHRRHAQQTTIAQVAHCDCGEAVCGCEQPTCNCGEPVCGCEPACGAEPTCQYKTACGYEQSCDCDQERPGLLGLLEHCNECDLGDPFTLFGEYCGWSAGGWASLGYHTAANSLFNTRPNEVQLQQAWLYAQKSIDTAEGFDIGGRIDYIYGTDGPNTQSFGTGQRGWDNSWDNGADYGHAIPQLYLEAGYGDLSVKVGHFYTIIGWEVVQATGNFFYSHAYTFNNSEPFTHTGALATYNLNQDITVWGGYVFGWDSGFDDNGDAYIGGVSVQMTDSLKLIYAAIGGRFGESPLGINERGYMHSIVADYAATENLQYIFQTDYLDTQNENHAELRNTIDINQYLIYSLSDCVSVGGRFEWYNNQGIYSASTDEKNIYALTTGINYRPHANVVLRPELRYDWIDNADNLTRNLFRGNATSSDLYSFGMDTVITF